MPRRLAATHYEAPVLRLGELRRTLRSELVRWFFHAHRPLPWRKTRDPYGIWVSEVMLQQTQVDRVIGYWEKFLGRFPTIDALAAAALPDVLSMWRGLGYYSRARNLHRAAQIVVAEHEGALPADLEQLRKLPGFGRYTAGAVASIAFNLATPIVDGNVARVFSRLFAIDAPVGEPKREATLWALASALVPGPEPGALNQALMELGATVCTPAKPTCLVCPVRDHCMARLEGRIEQLPPPKRRAQRQRLALTAGIAFDSGAVVLARRAEQGLFAGLWELPCVAQGVSAEQLHPKAKLGASIGAIERTLTHRDLVIELVNLTLPKKLGPPPPGYVEWRWVPVNETNALGMSSAMEAALAHVGKTL